MKPKKANAFFGFIVLYIYYKMKGFEKSGVFFLEKSKKMKNEQNIAYFLKNREQC